MASRGSEDDRSGAPLSPVFARAAKSVRHAFGVYTKEEKSIALYENSMKKVEKLDKRGKGSVGKDEIADMIGELAVVITVTAISAKDLSVSTLATAEKGVAA